MRIIEVEFEGKGVRLRVPETADIEQRMLASRPRTLFREKDGDSIDYDPETQLITVKNSAGTMRTIHASRASWMSPAEDSQPAKRGPGRPPKSIAQALEPKAAS